MKTAEAPVQDFEAKNALGTTVKVHVSWPKGSNEFTWNTRDYTKQCEGCPLFVPKSECTEIRAAVENDPERTEDFGGFTDKFLGICMLRSVTTNRLPRSTPQIVMLSVKKNNSVCLAYTNYERTLSR